MLVRSLPPIGTSCEFCKSVHLEINTVSFLFLLQAGSSEYCHQAVLTLVMVTESDQGEYVFLVRSPRGLAEGTVTLNVTRASSFSVADARAHHVTAAAAATAIYAISAWLVATNLR